MAVIVVATPGAANANSYLTVAEFQTYLETAFEPVEAANALDDGPTLVMATRTLNAMMLPHKRLVRDKPPHYIVSSTWTGAPATTTQALPWPRTGMYDANGNAIASDVIPQALKDATAELARLLKVGDRTADNEVAVQGITSVRAGSVALTFKEMIATNVVPLSVLNLMPPSWFTDELVYGAPGAEFDVASY